MTLILACLTKDTVFQVSDRRLTSFLPPHDPVDDERNKAVVVNGRISFGYTGLSSIGRTRTDDWLAKVIADADQNDMAQVAERVRARATKDFAALVIPQEYKRHAFQGTGWFRLRGETELSPGIITIHNALDKNGNWLDKPLPEFQVATEFPEKFLAGFSMNSVGVTPAMQEKGAVVRLMRKCINHPRATPRTIEDGLIKCLQWLSGRYPQIGSGLMVVRLPKEKFECFELY